MKNYPYLLIIVLSPLILASDRPIIKYYKNKLAAKEQQIIKEFCALRRIACDDFLRPIHQVKSYARDIELIADERSTAYKVEDTLSDDQKKEILSVLAEEGVLSVESQRIVQRKKEFESQGECGCEVAEGPYVIPFRNFWKCRDLFRKIMIRHEASHIRHEDFATVRLMEIWWDHVKLERMHQQEKFEKIINQFMHCHELRADSEAMISAPLSEIEVYEKVLKRDYSYEYATSIIRNALKGEISDNERKLFQEVLQLIEEEWAGKFDQDKHDKIEKVCADICNQPERFSHYEQLEHTRGPHYYPTYQERYQYCTRILGLRTLLEKYPYTGSISSKAREVILWGWAKYKGYFDL